MKLADRVFFHVVAWPFLRRILLPLAVSLFVVLQADAIIDWSVLRERLAASSPWVNMIVFTTLFTAWGLAAGAALRPVWRQPAIAFLVRAPLSRWQWVRYLSPSLSIAFLPVVGIWWLAPHHVYAPIHYVAFVGLVWTVILGGSYRGVTAIRWVAIGVILIAMLVLSYGYHPLAALPAIILSVVMLPMSIDAIRTQIVRPDQVKKGSLQSNSPTIAIVRRDILCLWRMERTNLSRIIQIASVAALFMLAFRINGQVRGREAFDLACGLLSLAALPIYDALTGLKTRLGPELMRGQWPISHRQRGIALLGVTVALATPSLISLSLIGSTMGSAYFVQFILSASTTLVALSALFSQTLLAAAASFGWSLWILLMNTLLVLALPSSLYVVMAASVILIGSKMIIAGLREFTEQSAIRIRE